MAHQQTWDPDRYARNARFVADLGAPVVDLLASRAGERILDLGCGDGVLTAKLASLGCHVIGVDASPQQIDAARKLGLAARVMNGEARRGIDGEAESESTAELAVELNRFDQKQACGCAINRRGIPRPRNAVRSPGPNEE
jgi:2-polyprenyl-3-methyl-5-hydroxy-6-metoxy-1,4-benzoquinol methylase